MVERDGKLLRTFKRLFATKAKTPNPTGAPPLLIQKELPGHIEPQQDYSYIERSGRQPDSLLTRTDECSAFYVVAPDKGTTP